MGLIYLLLKAPKQNKRKQNNDERNGHVLIIINTVSDMVLNVHISKPVLFQSPSRSRRRVS